MKVVGHFSIRCKFYKYCTPIGKIYWKKLLKHRKISGKGYKNIRKGRKVHKTNENIAKSIRLRKG